MIEPPSFIGEWVVRRNQSGTRLSQAHLVESEITDRLVMHCGRQMRLQIRDGNIGIFGDFSRDGTIWCQQCGHA